MAIIAMKKIRLAVHDRAASEALKVVQDMGVLELAEIPSEEQKLTQREKRVFAFNYTSSRLDFAVEFLARFAPKPSLRESMEGGKVSVREEELAELANSFYFNDAIDSLQDLEEKLNDVEAKLAAYTEEKALLSTWQDLNVTLKDGLATARTQTLLFKGSKDQTSQMVAKLAEEELPYNLVVEAPQRLAVVVLAEDADTIKKLASVIRLEMVTLPRRNGTPKEVIMQIEERESEEHARRLSIIAEIEKIVPLLPKIKCMSDYIYWKKEKHNVLSQAARTESVLVFEGWAPGKKLGELEDKLTAVTTHYSLEEIEPAEGEEAPVEIENRAAVKPFEALTRLYGMPAPGNLDPTLFLSGFFFIFFGMCLADAGYGLVLALGAGLALAFFRLPEGTKRFFQLFFVSGIATMIVGLFFGGYFGLEGKDISSATAALQIFQPVTNPLPIMFLSLALGIVQIMFGLFLKLVTYAKQGKLKDGLYEPGTWLLLFVALIVWGAQSFGYLAISHTLAVDMLYGALVLAVLGHGAHTKNIFLKPLMGLLSIFHESVGFFSDTLSYSRLLALGLASTALAATMNLIAGMVGSMAYVGGLLAILILILGHLFTIAIGVLGAFVHSVRLQYVEFFGKFISGSGRTFSPFKRKERHIALR